MVGVNNVNLGPKMVVELLHEPICLEQAVQPFGPFSIQKINKRNHSTLVLDCQTIFAQNPEFSKRKGTTS